MSDRSITEAIQQLAGTQLSDNIAMLPAIVTSVDQGSRTCECTPIGGNAVTDLTSVQLMAEVDDGFLLIPATGSTVIVAYSTRNPPYVAMFSEISKVLMVASDGIQFNGGEFGGLMRALVGLAKYNNLENAFNALNAKVNTLAPTPVIPPLVLTTEAELINESITHGS